MRSLGCQNPRRMRLRALRGAITVEANEAEAILVGDRGARARGDGAQRLDPEQIVSCIFTCTDDLDAEFPAVAARNLGLSRCRCCAPVRSTCRGRCR